MVIPITIDRLLETKVVEYGRIEFKRSWNPEPVLHALCAFADDIDNWGGGYIIIGVEENNGRPVSPIAGRPQGGLDEIMKGEKVI